MELSFHLEKRPDILASLNKTVQEKHEKNHPELFAKYQYSAIRSWFEERLKKENVYSLIIKLQDEPIGYVLLIHKRHTNQNPFLHPKYNVLLIDQMSIREEFQGKGIGSQAFEFIKDFANKQGIKRIHLDVWLENKEAVSFYSRLGFEPQRQVMEYLLEN